jgi:sulfotransferase family protein
MDLEPAPFVVGVGRSGTTLLRLMIDAHPEVAIPAETHFLPKLLRLRDEGDALRTAAHAVMTGESTWADFGIPGERLAEAFARLSPFTLANGLRAFYGLYAAKFGKPRWGEKTPFYGRRMRAIEAVLPEAHFVHVIRDGRDVALSLRPLWFSPGDEIEAQARNWLTKVSAIRANGHGCRHYLEIRYEDLVLDTESVLRRVCDFIALRYDPRMLSYHQGARDRLDEIGDEYRFKDARISKEARMRLHVHALHPPDPARVERWRSDMSSGDRDTFTSIAGALLSDLGYPLS